MPRHTKYYADASNIWGAISHDSNDPFAYEWDIALVQELTGA